MKKIILIICLFFIPFTVFAETTVIGEYGTYEDARNIIKEVMKSYYLRGPYMQYNYAKAEYGKYSPEEVTSQETKYAVCAAYTYDTYVEAFGVSSGRNFPPYNYSITTVGREYYQSDKPKDGTFLIYYENTTDTEDNAKYIYNNSDDLDDFISLIRPGDIFTFTGHALIAYDIVVNPNTNKLDVLILNSTYNGTIYSRISSSTSRLFYDNISKNNNNVLDIPNEGTVKYLWLSSSSHFVKDGKISCKEEECTVIRPFYENENGNAVFNYSILPSQYNKSLLRLEYPSLYIEKTVNVGDNNSVYLGDTLTYTIKITNKSNLSYENINYKSFHIEEELDDSLEYISSNGTIKGNKISWLVQSLNPNETITLQYEAKVKNNIKNVNKDIVSAGYFYGNDESVKISTGTVQNKIVASQFKEDTYATCYENKKDEYDGLNLINEIYKCVSDIDFHFNEFNFNNIYGYKDYPTAKGAQDVIYIKNELDNIHSQFYKMILNNYWSGLIPYKFESKTALNLPRWSGSLASIRNKNVNSTDFKDGDVLIYHVDHTTTYETSASNKKYTAENGMYAYIYLNNKFVGVNYSGETNERNEFTYNYYLDNHYYSDKNLTSYFYSKYTEELSSEELALINYQTLYGKDYYIILRPSLLSDILFKVNIYNEDETKQIIYNVTSSTKTSEFIPKIESNGVVTIFDKTNNVVENNSLVKTGYTIKTIFGAEENSPLEYKISVKGDTLGTGKADIESAKNISRHIVEDNAISGYEYLLAADYNGDNQIKMNDVIKLVKENS